MVQSEKAKKMRELKKFGKKVSEGCAPLGSRVHTQHYCSTADFSSKTSVGSGLLMLLFTMCVFVRTCVRACVHVCTLSSVQGVHECGYTYVGACCS